ncbi:DEAD/DEAH box helicase [Patulibacter sp. SYSU D01012]|uniref:DEAD/DEAH box helicase n=1 Tax=Patulibacter sp. SYSU D01012 TaxID=2817381 RepID=UPI001B306DFB|nr:DEAD/DEAH box helicase [Patulibacter sp. SYSU D01012]
MTQKTFAELGVSNAVVTALQENGMESPFAVQELALPDALAGRDILVSSPTGSGKTIAFGVALVEGVEATDPRPSALVLVPTRELATQIVDEIRELAHSRALAITAVFGGAGIEKQAKLASRSHILVATPGRLEDLLQRGSVSLAEVKMLVLDEADRMLDMGFQPAVKRIVSRTRSDRQTLFLSATLDGRVGEIARAYTRDPKLIEYTPPQQDQGKIVHHFRRVTRDEKIEHLVEHLRDAERGLTVVFVKTKFGADKVVRKLKAASVDAVALHGNRSQAQRRKALAAFEQGEVTTLVATDVAARGLDVEGVTHVLQYDIPVDMETYTHRVGRTGRAGRSGIGVTFVEPEEELDMGVMGRDLELHEELGRAGLRVAQPGEKGPGVQRKQAPRQPRPGREGGQGGGGRGPQGGGRRAGQSRSDHPGGGRGDGQGGRGRSRGEGGRGGHGQGGRSGGRSGGRQGGRGGR